MLKHKKAIVCAVVAVLVSAIFVTAAVTPKKEKVENTQYNSGMITEYEVSSNRHTKFVLHDTVVSLLTTDGFEQKMESDILSLWYNSDEESIRVVDKRSGYIWGCVDSSKETGLNKKWSESANSICYISYFNNKNSEVSAGLSNNTFSPKYTWKEKETKCKVTAKKLGISFSFSIKLDGEKITFTIDDKSIKETGKNILSKVSFVNFFGSVYEDTISGYILVPDGSGALIRFSQAKAYSSGYNKRVYGNDAAINKTQSLNNLNGNRTDDYATDEYSLSLPMWGMVHGENQNGFMATVDSGEGSAIISAIPAGAETVSVKFSRAYATFVYRNLYEKRVSNSKTVSEPEDKLNTINPEITYTFLTGNDANYSGMANLYREKLLKEKKIIKSGSQKDVSVLLNVIGSEVKQGSISNGLEVLTTADEAKKMLETLYNDGVANQNVILSGWTKGGYSGYKYGKTDFEKKVGTRSGIEKLRDFITNKGGKFSLALNPLSVNKDQININRQAALNATTNIMKFTIPNKTLMYPDTYYVRQSEMMNFMGRVNEELSDFDMFYEKIASTAYSDYTVGKEIDRDTAINNLLSTIEKSKQRIMVDYSNLYILNKASAIVGLPVSSSQYLYETDSVPFMQMVLRGSVDYYSPYSNQGFYSTASVLKMIEYGSYPSFMIMDADNFALYNTPLENYFSINFLNWREKISSVYLEVKETLSKTEGSSIISHKAVADGVYRIEYENGCVIWVNYMNGEYISEDGAVAPKGYLVKGGA